MPKTSRNLPNYVMDCDALLEVVQTQNNAVKSAAIGLLVGGKILVPTAVWKELKGGFEDEAASLDQYIPKESRIRMMPAHQLIAGTLASRLNSGFRVEPYGDSRVLALSVAVAEQCPLVTTARGKKYYDKIGGSTIMTLEELFVDWQRVPAKLR